MTQARWIITAAASAWAAYLAVHQATPVDRALPLLALVVVACAWVSHDAVAVAVPLLIAVEICVPAQTERLLLFGAVLALAALPAIWKGHVVAAVALLVALRWIPTPHFVMRELFLLVIAALIVFVLGRTPFAVAVAVIAVLVTPAIPLRTLALPLAVLGVSVLARIFGMPKIELRIPSAIVIGFAMLFFAWSGVVARAFPYFLKDVHPEVTRNVIAQALPPGKSNSWEVPEGARYLVLSGANVPQLRRGRMLGDVNGVPVRVGDAADWGFMRREVYYGAHNPLPRDPAGRLRGHGYDAWVDGAGRIALPQGTRVVHVTAAASLPAGAALQVEGFE